MSIRKFFQVNWCVMRRREDEAVIYLVLPYNIHGDPKLKNLHCFQTCCLKSTVLQYLPPYLRFLPFLEISCIQNDLTLDILGTSNFSFCHVD